MAHTRGQEELPLIVFWPQLPAPRGPLPGCCGKRGCAAGLKLGGLRGPNRVLTQGCFGRYAWAFWQLGVGVGWGQSSSTWGLHCSNVSIMFVAQVQRRAQAQVSKMLLEKQLVSGYRVKVELLGLKRSCLGLLFFHRAGLRGMALQR